jgi:sugar lactone lactonase YvrE
MITLLLIIVVIVLLYFLFWPVPIKPISWKASIPPEATGDLAVNDRLAEAEQLPAGGPNPEDIIVDTQGRIYTGLEDGRIMRMQADGSEREQFATTNGRPLGLAFDAQGNLIVADAEKGLLSIDPQGELRILVDRVNGRRLNFANHLDIAADGKIYFSESSDHFTLHEMAAEIFESRPNGRLFIYDPQSAETKLILDNLYCANGIAIDPEQNYLLVCETTRYRLRKIWLEGPKAGQDEIFIDNLPGFPDNLHHNGRDTFWLGLILVRNPIIDKLAGNPFLRKLIFRLPEAIKPKPKRHGYVIGLDAEGRITHNLQDPSGVCAWTSSALEHDGQLYVGSMSEDFIAKLAI